MSHEPVRCTFSPRLRTKKSRAAEASSGGWVGMGGGWRPPQPLLGYSSVRGRCAVKSPPCQPLPCTISVSFLPFYQGHFTFVSEPVVHLLLPAQAAAPLLSPSFHCVEPQRGTRAYCRILLVRNRIR